MAARQGGGGMVVGGSRIVLSQFWGPLALNFLKDVNCGHRTIVNLFCSNAVAKLWSLMNEFLLVFCHFFFSFIAQSNKQRYGHSGIFFLLAFRL